MILATEEVITTTLNIISATTKLILATEEVITDTLMVISAITKDILAQTNWCYLNHDKGDIDH